MAEEIKVEPVVEGSQEQAPQHTPSELQAMEQGWVPKDQWSGDGKWRDAESFLDRGELFSKIDKQNRELRSLKESNQEVKRYLENVKELEYKKALDTLRNEKKAALKEGDADAVIAIEDKLDELRDEQAEQRIKQATAPAQKSNGEQHPEFQAFVNKNPWYQTNRPMRSYADALGVELREEGKSPSEVLRAVEQAVRKEFPQRFTNPNRDKPSGVEGGGNPGGSTSKDTLVMSDDEKRIMNRILSTGVSKEQYLKDFKEIKARG